MLLAVLLCPLAAGAVAPDTIVYVTPSGSKYHREDCSYTSTVRSMTITQAENQGYTPCSRCDPHRITGAYEPPAQEYSSGSGSRSSSSSSGTRSWSPPPAPTVTYAPTETRMAPPATPQQSAPLSASASSLEKAPLSNGQWLLVIVCFAGIEIALPLLVYRFFDKRREKRRKEQKFLAEKAAFLQRLGGQSLRQAAGVPAHITFVDGLPKDNNDAKYGSFTVYRSLRGQCYHAQELCFPSVYHPLHLFEAIERYQLRPCTWCYKGRSAIPQWYKDYAALKTEAQRLGVAEEVDG